MKKTTMVLTALMVFGMMAQANAARLSYDPGAVALTLEQGGTGSFAVQVNSEAQSSGSLDLVFGARVVSGNLPSTWVAPQQLLVSARSLSAGANVMVMVPDMAPPGIYSGYLVADLVRNVEPVDIGRGVEVTVEVASLQKCIGGPEFELGVADSTRDLPWKHKTAEVQVSGTLVMPEGCEIQKIWYEVKDEYTAAVSTGETTVDEAGKFSFAVKVEASRRGQDKDGRQYSGTLFVLDEEGNKAARDFTITVAHDQGKRGKHGKYEKDDDNHEKDKHRKKEKHKKDRHREDKDDH